MPLSDAACRNAKPKEKPYKLGDAGGLYLQVTPSGSRLWRMKYRHGGLEKTLSFGPYPEISLADAREKRDWARKLKAHGQDPSFVKKEEARLKAISETNTFEAVARKWHEKNKQKWVSVCNERDEIGRCKDWSAKSDQCVNPKGANEPDPIVPCSSIER